jgi:hypothetical protein
MNKYILSTVLFFAVCSSVFADDEHLSIKEFHLGMSKADIKAVEKVYCLYSSLGCGLFHSKPNFTIGGIGMDWIVLESQDIGFTFPSSGFDLVKNALLTKYPATVCVDSDITNRLGTHFVQTSCKIVVGEEGIVLCRYATNLSTSQIELESLDIMKSRESRLNATKSDI